jgi:uncharacterized protein (DUF1501 family)
MRRVREILRLKHECGATDRAIARSLGIARSRDLTPTTDLRAVLKGLLRDHLGVAERVLAADVFPDSAAVKPMPGLVA